MPSVLATPLSCRLARPVARLGPLLSTSAGPLASLSTMADQRALFSRFDAIVFDKDGTLLDFAATWNPAIHGAIESAAPGDDTKQAKIAAALGFDIGSRTCMLDAPVVHKANTELVALLSPLTDGGAEAAVLCCAVLCCAVLCCAILCVMCCAVLCCAPLAAHGRLGSRSRAPRCPTPSPWEYLEAASSRACVRRRALLDHSARSVVEHVTAAPDATAVLHALRDAKIAAGESCESLAAAAPPMNPVNPCTPCATPRSPPVNPDTLQIGSQPSRIPAHLWGRIPPPHTPVRKAERSNPAGSSPSYESM